MRAVARRQIQLHGTPRHEEALMARTDLQSRDYESRQLDVQEKEYAIRRRRQTISVIPVGLLGVAVIVGGGGCTYRRGCRGAELLRIQLG